VQPGHEAHHEGIKREHARNYGQGVGAKSLLHFGVGFCKFYVNLGKAELNFSKSVVHVGTYVCEFGSHFGAYVGELDGDFGAEVGELEFHLGLGEDGRRGDVVFGREAVPVDGRNGVHQLGRVFFAKDANEFVRDAKPSCFIKCHCVAFRFSMQVKCDRDSVCTGNKSGWTKLTFA